MNLRRISVFVKVVEEGTFASAARSLGVPRSAVSQAVSTLERELGVRLLHRSSRAMSVTDAGAALYGRCAPALRTLAEASAEVTDQATSLRGRVRMTAPVEVGMRLLEPILSAFLGQHPGVSLDLVLTTELLDLTGNGIDLAVRGGPVHDESLVARKLGGHPESRSAGLYASPSYLARAGEPRSLDDLSSHDAVVLKSSRGSTDWRLEGPSGSATVVVQPRLTVDASGFALRAATSGVGIALLPLFLCEDEVRLGKLVRVLPEWGLPEKKLWLVYSSARYLPRPVAELRDAILRAFAA
ncbi:MAG: LysR substrate-binding domain-containing protein [Polyangiaceae bacterium]